jgi:hypothetical protein
MRFWVCGGLAESRVRVGMLRLRGEARSALLTASLSMTYKKYDVQSWSVAFLAGAAPSGGEEFADA